MPIFILLILLFFFSSRDSNKMADAAVIEKLEAGFKKLEAATDCKSLLKKYLTRDIFDKLKDKKTALGATLLDVIQSGEWTGLCNYFNLL